MSGVQPVMGLYVTCCFDWWEYVNTLLEVLFRIAHINVNVKRTTDDLISLGENNNNNKNIPKSLFEGKYEKKIKVKKIN